MDAPKARRSDECRRQSKPLLVKRKPTSSSSCFLGGTSSRTQYSSFVLFLSVVILVNLCPFNQENPLSDTQIAADKLQVDVAREAFGNNYQIMHRLDTCLKFVKLMFTSPIKLGTRTTRFSQAEAKVIGKMAKMWYIKKKIKKLSKKLKKHTIAVPVFTAIPIYEHSYYPHQQHVGHVSAGMHHAASSYSPTGASPTTAVLPLTQQVAAAAANTVAAAVQQQQQQSQQLATSASDTHHQRMAAAAAAYHQQRHRAPANHYHHQLAAATASTPIYHHHPHHQMPSSANAHQIINSYAPSPPLFVDEAGGLYGQYGNAYGRYDGGYQLW